MFSHHASHKSATVENTLKPTFDEAWTFKIHKSTTHVQFMIVDNDPIGSDDPIGEIRLSMEEVMDKATGAEWDKTHEIQPELDSHSLPYVG